MSESNIEKLIEQASGNDPLACSQLIETYQDEFYKYCLFLTGSSFIADDVFQDSWIKAFGNLKGLKEPKFFKTWLFRIAKNLFLDYLKSSKVSKTHIPLDIEAGIELPSEDSNKEDFIDIWNTLNTIDKDKAEVIVHIDLMGLSYQETAQILETTESAIRSRLHKARKSFSQHFYRNDSDS